MCVFKENQTFLSKFLRVWWNFENTYFWGINDSNHHANSSFFILFLKIPEPLHIQPVTVNWLFSIQMVIIGTYAYWWPTPVCFQWIHFSSNFPPTFLLLPGNCLVLILLLDDLVCSLCHRLASIQQATWVASCWSPWPIFWPSSLADSLATTLANKVPDLHCQKLFLMKYAHNTLIKQH